MKVLHSERLERLGRIAFFAILVAFVLAPRPVSAGCNNHGRSASSSPWRTAQLDALLRGDLAAELTTTDEPKPAPPTCSGPSCSNNVPAPLSPILDRDLGQHRGDSLLAFAPRLPVSASRVFHAADEPLAPTFPTSRVFHPPRPIV